jgi:hypothetical protein
MEVSKKENIIVVWLNWHFFEMPGILIGVWKNYLMFTLEYFSIPFLLATLISPWRQYRWNYPNLFNRPGEWLGNLIFNTFSRFIGFLCRLVLIATGIIAEILMVIVGIIAILFWVLMPLIMVVLVIFLFVI